MQKRKIRLFLKQNQSAFMDNRGRIVYPRNKILVQLNIINFYSN